MPWQSARCSTSSSTTTSILVRLRWSLDNDYHSNAGSHHSSNPASHLASKLWYSPCQSDSSLKYLLIITPLHRDRRCNNRFDSCSAVIVMVVKTLLAPDYMCSHCQVQLERQVPSPHNRIMCVRAQVCACMRACVRADRSVSLGPKEQETKQELSVAPVGSTTALPPQINNRYARGRLCSNGICDDKCRQHV